MVHEQPLCSKYLTCVEELLLTPFTENMNLALGYAEYEGIPTM